MNKVRIVFYAEHTQWLAGVILAQLRIVAWPGGHTGFQGLCVLLRMSALEGQAINLSIHRTRVRLRPSE